MKDHERNDPLWAILKNAGKTGVSPFFSRNVLREVRLYEDQKGRGGIITGVLAFLKQRTVVACLTGVACVVLILGVMHFQNAEGPIAAVIPVESTATETDIALAGEIEAVEYLGQLMAVVDPGQLSDDALADLFF